MTMTVEQFVEQMDADTLVIPAPKCARCKCELQECLTGNRYTEDGYVCSDCYFDALGDVVEKYPIRSFRIRRG